MKNILNSGVSLSLLVALTATIGCRSKPVAKNTDFFTSGSREADQRASQRMAKAEQLDGSGEGTVARVSVRVRRWTPGLHPPAVAVRMISEPADRLDAARAAGWSEPSAR